MTQRSTSTIARWLSLGGRRRVGYGLGLALGAAALVAFASDPETRLVAKGPANPGHAALDCGDCHEPAPGSLRQQLQATAAFWIGNRDSPATIGHLPVGNATCLDCHSRPDDRHPSYRFLESRFAEARLVVRAQECTACHREHDGRRVANDGQFCVACHGELELEEEPIKVAHKTLVAKQRWDTCLRCHDFHGNHEHRPPHRVSEGIDLGAVEEYLADGEPIFGPPRTPAALERSRE